MAAVSSISAMKVEMPRSCESPAPTRTRMASTIEMEADSAGTKHPIWAISTTIATCRMYLYFTIVSHQMVNQACRVSWSCGADQFVRRLAAHVRPGDDLNPRFFFWNSQQGMKRREQRAVEIEESKKTFVRRRYLE
jgi:hypothetical protein